MDVAAVIFYGIICGGLAGVAPTLGKNMWFRVVVGAAVGIGAAFVLPSFRSMIY